MGCYDFTSTIDDGEEEDCTEPEQVDAYSHRRFRSRLLTGGLVYYAGSSVSYSRIGRSVRYAIDLKLGLLCYGWVV